MFPGHRADCLQRASAWSLVGSTFSQHKGCFLKLKGDLATADTLYLLSLLVPCQTPCNADELRCCVSSTVRSQVPPWQNNKDHVLPHLQGLVLSAWERKVNRYFSFSNSILCASKDSCVSLLQKNGNRRFCCLPICLHNGGRLETHRWTHDEAHV